MRTLSSLAVIGAVGAAVVAATAHAAPPAPCNGAPQITDATGDGHHANTDVVQAWFSEGAGRLQAVIKPQSAIWEPAHDDSEAAGFAVLYEQGGQIRYVRAEAPRGPARFDHGTWTPAGGFATAGATSGTTETGAGGAVTIDLPGVPAGTVLARPFVLTYDGGADPDRHWVDRAPGGTSPDGAEVGADYVAGSCGGGPGTPGGGGTPTGPQPLTSVSLTAPKRLVGGGRALVAGAVTPARAGVPVTLSASSRRPSTHQTSTGPDGRFALRVPVNETTRLRAVAEGLGSQTLTVVVRSRIRIKVRRLRSGKVRVSGRVRPALPGRVLLLRSDAVRPIQTVKPRRGSFRFRAKRLRRGRYQAVYIPSRSRALRSTSNTGVVR